MSFSAACEAPEVHLLTLPSARKLLYDSRRGSYAAPAVTSLS
jgi:hypothetical protein